MKTYSIAVENLNPTPETKDLAVVGFKEHAEMFAIHESGSLILYKQGEGKSALVAVQAYAPGTWLEIMEIKDETKN